MNIKKWLEGDKVTKKMTKFEFKIFLIASILFIAIGIPTAAVGYVGGIALLLFGIANIITLILLHKEIK